MTKFKDKKRILKALREKQLTTRELPQEFQLIFPQKHFTPERIGLKYSNDENRGPTTKTTLLSNAII